MCELSFVSICVKIGVAVKFAQTLNIVNGDALQTETRLLYLICHNRSHTTVIDKFREYL